MAGLLGDPYDPLTAGLLNAAAVLGTPRHRGGGVGRAGLAFLEGGRDAAQYQRQLDQDRRRNELVDSQVEENKAQAAARRAALELAQRQAEGRAGALQSMMPAPVGFRDVSIAQSGVTPPAGYAPPSDKMRLTPQAIAAYLQNGGKADDLKMMAESGNIGRAEIAHILSVAEGGQEAQQGITKYGDKVGPPIVKGVDQTALMNRAIIPDGKGGWMENPLYMSAHSKVASAGASRQINLVNAFQPASEEAQKDFMKGLRARYDQLQSAPAVLENIEKAKSLARTPNAFVGSFGDKKMAVAQFFNQNFGTNIKASEIANATELQSRLFISVMENLKKMDAQPSQYQQQVMQDAFGRLTTDPNALPAVLDVFGDIVKSKVKIHNQEAAGAVQQGVKFPYNPIIDLPAAPATSGAEQSFQMLPNAATLPGKTVRDTVSNKRYKSDGTRWKEVP